MRRLAALLSFIATIAFAGSSQGATLHRGTVAPVSSGVAAIFCSIGGFGPCAQLTVIGSPLACPQGTAFPDGCPGANPSSGEQVASAFSPGGYFNTKTGITTNYAATRPPNNVAFVDFPVGAFTPVGMDSDPVAATIPGCTHGTSTHGNPQLNCTGSSFVGPITALNFGAAFGHACTVLNINPTGVTASKISITNNHFTNDGNCGFQSFNEFMVNAGSYTYETDYMYNSFNGSGATFPYNTCNGTADGGATCSGAAALNTWGIVQMKYNSFIDFAARPIYFNMNPGQTTDITFDDNYVEGFDYHPFNGHVEFIVGNPSNPGLVNGPVGFHAHYNTIVQTTNGMQFGPGDFFLASSWAVDYSLGIDLVGNTIINGLMGGASYNATVSGCIGATFSSGVCSGAGTNFWVTAISPPGATIGHGEELGGAQGGPLCTNNVGGAPVFAWISANVSGGHGVGSEWTLDSGSLPPTLWSAGPATCTNLQMWAVSSNTYVWQGSGFIRHVDHANVQNNYVDGSSSWVPRDGQVNVFYSLNGNGVNFNGTISGTALTVNSGTAPSISQNVVGAGITGCTSDPTTCPTIVSGTNPNFVLSSSGGTVGPEAMSGEQPTVCATPANVSGNVDMAGVATSATMNPTFGGPPFTIGCVTSPLTTPTIIPQVSSNFNQNQAHGATNNGLLPNYAGSAGALEYPTIPTNSHALYFEATIDPSLAFNQGVETSGFFNVLTNVVPGQPTVMIQRLKPGTGSSNFPWWLGTALIPQSSLNATAGFNYNTGFYPLTATGGGCIRPPSGVWFGGSGSFQVTDPGFGCATAPTINMNTVPNAGGQQTGITATCAASAVSGQMLVTTSVPVSPGLSPGLQYSLSAFTTSPTNVINATFTATSVTGSGPYTVVGTAGGTCPTISSTGTFGAGTGAAISFPAPSPTNPFGFSGGTGITTKNGQHVCGIIGQYGDDAASPFPGAQFVHMVDDNGNALNGAPALVPLLNQGTANATGYTLVNTQSPSSPALTITAMNPYVITGTPTYSGTTGYVTFTTTTTPGFIPGSEFTVSGVNSTGASLNRTYVAVNPSSLSAASYQTSTTIVGNPLSGGPGSTPQAIASPGTVTLSGSPQMVSVIMPGMTILGDTGNAIVSPYGTFGSTGTGSGNSVTYGLSANQTVPLGSSGSPVKLYFYPPYYFTAVGNATPAGGTVTTSSQGLYGDLTTILGSGTTTPNGNLHTGWGGSLGNVSMLWGAFPQTAGIPSTTALANLCKKTPGFDLQSFAATQTAVGNPMTVHSLLRLNDPGIWGDSSVADFTGTIAGTALTIVSTQTGATTALPANTIISGAGITGCPSSCPKISTGSGTNYVLNAAGGTISTGEAMKAGAFNPAKPVPSTNFKGFTAGNTLTVTSLDNGSQAGLATFTGTLGTSFTATIDNGSGGAGNTLTVTSPGGVPPANAVVGVGTKVCPPVANPSAFTCATVTALGTGGGLSGTYTLNGSAQLVASQTMYGGGPIPGFATTLQITAGTGSLSAGMFVIDATPGTFLTGTPLLVTGGGGSVWSVVGNYYPASSAPTSMIGSLSTLVPGEYIQNSSITTPVKILGYAGAGGVTGAFNGGLGAYTLSTGANGSIGSSGTPAVFAGTTITDGGVIAAGPALTIRNHGPGVIFPVNHSTGTGTLALSGTYDVPTLGGTPSGIQVLVSNSANGPALSGCTPCNWGALSGTPSSGTWSGSIAGIPSGGPFFVSVRAANGTAYATLPDSIRVGDAYGIFGEGQADALAGSQAGTNVSWFQGLWGFVALASPYSFDEHYVAGPPVSAASPFTPSQSVSNAGDRFGAATIAEAPASFDQGLYNANGIPASYVNSTRNGTGFYLYTLGGAAQSQTVGFGNGSISSWCSAAIFCPSAGVSVSGPLFFNGASRTGVTFAGASISSGTLSIPASGITQGAPMPGMILSDTTGVITGSPTLVRCITNCTIANFNASLAQTWATSNGSLNVSAETMRGDPVGGAPWPNFAMQQDHFATIPSPFGGFALNVVQAGTFSISVNGTVVCADSSVFAYNVEGGNCTAVGGSGVSGFVNYMTGDFNAVWSGTPPTGAITASWTNIVSPEANLSPPFNRPVNLDFFGNGTAQSGEISSIYNKTPAGVSGYIDADTEETSLTFEGPGGYPFASVGLSQMVSWLYNTRFATLPGSNSSGAFINTGRMRISGGIFYSIATGTGPGYFERLEQWHQDSVTKSTFSGTIASNVLTLGSSPAVGQMWEGEIIGGTGVPQGIFIINLASGTWGAAGSTYNLSGASGVTIGATTAMHNAVYYSGPGPAFYAGGLYDISIEQNGDAGTTGYNQHANNGFAAGRRVGSRWAAAIWGGPPPVGNGTASVPTLDRVASNAVGCEALAPAAPCDDIANTYAVTATPTAVSSNKLTFNGLTAHTRPIVVGHAVSCSGCASNLVVTSIDHPPTQDTRAGQGQIGSLNNGFIVTLNAAPGVSGVPFTFGCKGTAGSSSNCIDIAISVNNTGAFGTAAAIATCGANNLNGNSPNYVIPTGKCQDNGIGEIVRTFRIGTLQNMGTGGPGSLFDDGTDTANGSVNQSAAFTCNIVAAKVVQCVKGAAYTSGVYSGIGAWTVGNTFVNYGSFQVTGKLGDILAPVGGQPFPITTPGSGYTNGLYTITASCPGLVGGGILPVFDVTVSGGAITNVYLSAVPAAQAMGSGIVGTCTVPVTSIPSGSGGVISTIQPAPVEGKSGIATYNSDSNTMGLYLYDNSGFVGNPLNQFFTNGMGGYFEPGLPLESFGSFMGAAVSF